MPYGVSAPVAGAEVDAWSMVRLPFEPRGELADFRRDLATACRTLVAERGQILHASYTSRDRGPVDLENVLTYNLGTGAIRAAAGHGLVLERSCGAGTHPHHYRYRLVDRSTTWTSWTPSQPLGSITLSAPPHLFTTPKAGRWWLHARRHGTLTAARPTSTVPERFALRLTVTPPSGWRGHLVSLLKPLTDGLLAAMHSHDEDPALLADRAPTIDDTFTPNEFRALLRHPGPLGPTRLVVRRGNTLQWLPADDRIVALDARLAPDREAGTVHGEALAVVQSGVARV